MMELLSKTRLSTLTRQTYGHGVEAVFYKVTPSAGPVEIGRIASGFFFVRERRAGQEIDGSGVEFWLSADAAIDGSTLHRGAAVELIIGSRTSRYKISELLPMQQLGGGYVMRLSPQTGATA